MEFQSESANPKPRFIFMHGPKPKYGKVARAHVLKDHMKHRREKAQYPPVRIRRGPLVANADTGKRDEPNAGAMRVTSAALGRECRNSRSDYTRSNQEAFSDLNAFFEKRARRTGCLCTCV